MSERRMTATPAPALPRKASKLRESQPAREPVRPSRSLAAIRGTGVSVPVVDPRKWADRHALTEAQWDAFALADSRNAGVI